MFLLVFFVVCKLIEKNETDNTEASSEPNQNFSEISKNTFSYRTPPVAASVNVEVL